MGEVKHTPKIIIIRETAMEGVINDLSMFGVVAVLIGLGVYLDSSAMQWFGFVAGVLLLFTKSAGNAKRNTFTIEGARKRLDEIEAEACPNA